MPNITIITDSTCDLSLDLISKNKIIVLPLYVNFGDDSYLDGKTIDTFELYDKVNKTGIMPKTAAISPGVFYDTFKNELAKGNEIIYMGIGSKFSTTLQNAYNASLELDPSKIALVDSLNLSTGIGLLLMKTVKYRDEGLSLMEIKSKVEGHVGLVRTQFAIDTLDYLHKGGRCSGTVKLFGTLLKFKPIIRVLNGKMEVAKKPRGKFIVALNALRDYVLHDIDNIDLDYLMISDTMAFEDLLYLKNEIVKRTDKFNEKNIHINKAGCVIFSHCGPRTVGIYYLLKE